MANSYIRNERVFLKSSADYNEKWVQKLIAEDPSILGLGDLILRDQERLQPRAGRLDLLLQDPETTKRYEVELQLGATDESHIIRSIEYWDIERKRYPQYDHCAVLIAEDITSRFLNVISLFNGAIPLIALQMQALKVGGSITLAFTTVVDEFSRGLIDDDEDAAIAPADRPYWEKRATKMTLSMVDSLLKITKELDSSLELNYNKAYIGLYRQGQAFNFVQFRPKKAQVNIEIRLPKTDETDAKIEESDLVALEYRKRWNQYQLRLTKSDVDEKRTALLELMKMAYNRRVSG